MIKPLRACDKASGFFFVCDIENNPDGSVISIDSAWRNDTHVIEHVLHDTWEAWIDWLIPMARNDKRFRTVYAHNGGGWDWLSLASYLVTDGQRKRQTITVACAASKMITMTVKFADQFSIHFCDSLQLLRSSLDKLGKSFVGRGKIDTGGLLPHQMERVKMLEYQRGDTELLLLVLEKALELIREKVAKIDTFGFTVGSTAMKVFKTMALKEPISIPWNPIEREFFREGYTGGRVEVFAHGHYERVRVYDVNSLYPYAMLTTDVPLSDRTMETTTINEGCVGVFRITFRQHRKDIPAVLTKGGKGIYAGSGVYFSPEILLLREVDPQAEIEVEKGYEFVDTGKVFQDYVNSLYALRLADPDGPLSLLCKYLLNSLYGKFGQKTEREQIVCFNDLEEIANMIPDEGESPVPINEEKGIYKLVKEQACAFEHIGIAGMITATARVILFRGILAAGSGAVIYCDTDSVHTTGEMPPEMTGKKLGQFKLEFDGEGVYCGKKLYGLRDNHGRSIPRQYPACDRAAKIRAKGVSVGGHNGCRLSFADLCRISRGEKYEAKFSQPTTALQTFGLKPPCVFSVRTRTLKVT